jgi:hypothetical protein
MRDEHYFWISNIYGSALFMDQHYSWRKVSNFDVVNEIKREN